jgi:hypothetical protein
MASAAAGLLHVGTGLVGLAFFRPSSLWSAAGNLSATRGADE